MLQNKPIACLGLQDLQKEGQMNTTILSSSYYELTLRIQLGPDGTWNVSLHRPGLTVTHEEAGLLDQSQAERAALCLAQSFIHQYQADKRPIIGSVAWKPSN
jgi:hypothetical protein